MAKFWITSPRFVQQVGDVEPRYVAASPDQPVLIELPDNFYTKKDCAKTSKGTMRPESAPTPEKPKLHFVDANENRKVPKAHERHGRKGRASDEE